MSCAADYKTLSTWAASTSIPSTITSNISRLHMIRKNQVAIFHQFAEVVGKEVITILQSKYLTHDSMNFQY